MKSSFYILTMLLAFATASLFAQNPTLSIQGTVQNSSGAAVTDGSYSLTFKLYTVASSGSAIWTETQSGVPIQSGVYSAELGSVTALNVAFDAAYFLGVSVDGGAEMAPRARLTAAPYALSLRGQENVFGSTGAVGIGTATPASDSKLHVKKGSGDAKILAEGSTSATLHLQAGTDSATVKVNSSGNLELNRAGSNKVTVKTDGVSINGKVQLATNGDVELGSGGNIKYGTNNDWRLVDIDDFSTDTDGWACQQQWNDTASKGIHRFQPNTPFSKGWLLGPDNTADANDVLWKLFDLSAHPHTMVKVVFTMHFAGSWDDNEACIAVFSTEQASTATGANNNGKFQIGWSLTPNEELSHDWYNREGYIPTTASEALDFNRRGEMVAQTDLNSFYILFGGGGNESTTNERFYISDVEVWVK